VGCVGQSVMNTSYSTFYEDDGWQKGMRDKLLKPFYGKCSEEGRFVFMDKGRLSDILQRQFAVDTVLQGIGKENRAVGIEEKIVRWPQKRNQDGRKRYPNGYQSFTLETWSNTVEEFRRKGWMYTAQCDFLFYCYVQEFEQSAIGYLMPFPKLKNWFFYKNKFEMYIASRTDQRNRTETLIVPIEDVVKAIPETRIYTLRPNGFLPKAFISLPSPLRS